MGKHAVRKEIYSIEAVLEKVVPPGTPKNESKVEFDGDLIKMNSHRYDLFKHKGVKCVCCGIEGKYFVKERPAGTDSFHFNLYAVDMLGNEVLMTKDHIIPKSKRGRNHLSNYQTMCAPCNVAKGDTLK